MIVIYYNTGDNLFVKKYDGDEFELISAEQTFTNGASKADCSFTLKTDLGEVINIDMPIEFYKNDDGEKEISNLKHFAIASKSRTVMFNKGNSKDKDKDVFQDFRVWISGEISNILKYVEKQVEVQNKKADIEKDFTND